MWIVNADIGLLKTHLRLLLLTSVLATGLLCSAPIEAAGRKYALVIGVSTYRPGQPLPMLPYAENDANDLAQVLTEGGYNVTLMTQSVGRMEGKEVLAPMSSFIRDQLDALLSNPNLKTNDIVIVALAGHGVQYDLLEGPEKSAKFYFCPTDANIADLNNARNVTASNNILDLAELYGALNQCQAGGKLLLVDACRNDPSKPAVTRSLASVTLPRLPPPPGGTAAFFSCSANQRAYEDKDLKHGVFFHQVIKALKGDADVGNDNHPADGQITLAELSENVGPTTYDFVRNKYNGAKQSPELKGEFRLPLPLISVRNLMKGRFAESQGIKLIPIPSGEFMMGSSDDDLERVIAQYSYTNKTMFTNEQPKHKVRITKLAAMSAHEITVEQFRKFVNDTQYKTDAERDGVGGTGWNEVKGESEGPKPEYSWRNPGFPQTDLHPVVNVSWNDAVAYCEWLSKNDGRIFRLPSEAEWEYCARGESTGLFPNGNDAKQLVRIGNVGDLQARAKLKKVHPLLFESRDDGYAFTSPVGHFEPNSFGLYDMIGNVWEWCSDGFDSKFYGRSPLEDPLGTSGLSDRVLRGGCWAFDGHDCRSAKRHGGNPSSRYDSIGFRVVLSR